MRQDQSRQLGFPLTASQSAPYFAQAVSAAELAEKHGDELSPACEAFGGVIGTVLQHGLLKFNSRNSCNS